MVNISLQKDLMAALDAVAMAESRTRSELLREAARQYIERYRRWEAVCRLAAQTATQHGIRASDVATEIAAHRAQRHTRRFHANSNRG